MARSKSEFLRAFGKAWEIFKALIDEVLSLGGSDEQVARILTDKVLRRKLAELIVGAASNVYIITVDYAQSLADMIKAGHYDFVDPSFTSEHFPVVGTGEVSVDAILVHYGRIMSSEAVLADLDQRGLRPATLPELLAFGATYPEKQREFPILAFGAVWEYSARYVAVLDWDDDLGRYLGLGLFVDDWRERCHFLAVKK